MSSYVDTVRAASGTASTQPTRSTGSTGWAENLAAKYGISAAMAPDDGLDEEHGAAVAAHGALN